MDFRDVTLTNEKVIRRETGTRSVKNKNLVLKVTVHSLNMTYQKFERRQRLSDTYLFTYRSTYLFTIVSPNS